MPLVTLAVMMVDCPAATEVASAVKVRSSPADVPPPDVRVPSQGAESRTRRVDEQAVHAGVKGQKNTTVLTGTPFPRGRLSARKIHPWADSGVTIAGCSRAQEKGDLSAEGG